MSNIKYLPFTHDELKESLEKKHVSIRPHPTEDLYIFNYTPLVQYDRHWNDITKTCRGLILDDEYNIVARPFQKIFNYTEIVPDPVVFNGPPVISDKLDGSLGIIYKTPDGYKVATRGSFESDQAIWATEWLNKNLPNYDQPGHLTCLVEIIYPDNRICVNYGARAELILLAVINDYNGADIPTQSAWWWKGPIVDRVFGYYNLEEIYRHATSHDYDDKEGVVCTWYKFDQPSFRLKIKHPEYVRLHGIIHSFSKKKVWESLSKGEDFMKLLDDVPDEFYEMVREVVNEFYDSYSAISKTALEEYQTIKHITSRKDFAAKAKQLTHPAIMFRLADDKDYYDIIWKLLKPKEKNA